MAQFKLQTELEYMVGFPESLNEPLIRDSEEASVKIFSFDESRRDYPDPLPQ